MTLTVAALKQELKTQLSTVSPPTIDDSALDKTAQAIAEAVVTVLLRDAIIVGTCPGGMSPAPLAAGKIT